MTPDTPGADAPIWPTLWAACSAIAALLTAWANIVLAKKGKEDVKEKVGALEAVAGTLSTSIKENTKTIKIVADTHRETQEHVAQLVGVIEEQTTSITQVLTQLALGERK